mgnify:CR=1 FL=1
MDEQKRRKIIIGCLIAMVAVMLLNMLVYNQFFNPKAQQTEVTYNQFLEDLNAKNVDTVQVNQDVIYYTRRGSNSSARLPDWIVSSGSSSHVYYTVAMNDPELVDRLYQAGATFSQVQPQGTSIWTLLLVNLVFPLLLFWGLGTLLMRRMRKNGMGGNFMSFGKSNAKVYVKADGGVKFADVAGEDEAKEALQEIVDFLHNPGKYQQIGASMPKGALLVGPPGTGKTLLAKAVAGEANVPFFSMSGSEFVEMFVGMGAAKVRDLFKQAAEKAPCIVFIDEIDTVGKKRDAQGVTGNDEREQTLNQLLTEMDGFDASKGVVILGACNRPDSLDPALLRPGRFDRRIPVELPDLTGREAILKVHAKKVKLADHVDFRAIARAASGASGADLANLVNEAALRAVRMGRDRVTQEDLEESIETVMAGFKRKNKVLNEKEKAIVSYHEVGHAMVATLQKASAPVTKITIVPRTSGALGYTMQVDEDEHMLMTKEELENKICTLTGGRAAEMLAFNSATSGASNDIEQATKLARAMIGRFGMSDDIGMVALETVQNVYLGGDTSLSCSNALAEEVDRKVIALVKTQYERALALLQAHRSQLDYLAKELYEKEVLTGEEFNRLMQQSSVSPVPTDDASTQPRLDS